MTTEKKCYELTQQQKEHIKLCLSQFFHSKEKAYNFIDYQYFELELQNYNKQHQLDEQQQKILLNNMQHPLNIHDKMQQQRNNQIIQELEQLYIDRLNCFIDYGLKSKIIQPMDKDQYLQFLIKMWKNNINKKIHEQYVWWENTIMPLCFLQQIYNFDESTHDFQQYLKQEHSWKKAQFNKFQRIQKYSKIKESRRIAQEKLLGQINTSNISNIRREQYKNSLTQIQSLKHIKSKINKSTYSSTCQSTLSTSLFQIDSETENESDYVYSQNLQELSTQNQELIKEENINDDFDFQNSYIHKLNSNDKLSKEQCKHSSIMCSNITHFQKPTDLEYDISKEQEENSPVNFMVQVLKNQTPVFKFQPKKQ